MTKELTTDDKPHHKWPCHCCSCTSVPADTPDPACHVHGLHGRRGCIRHEVTPQHCGCATCSTDPHLESARHAEMLARGYRFTEAQAAAAQNSPIITEDDPEDLARLAEARRKAAAELAEAQQAQFNAAVAAAVEVALAAREQGASTSPQKG